MCVYLCINIIYIPTRLLKLTVRLSNGDIFYPVNDLTVNLIDFEGHIIHIK